MDEDKLLAWVLLSGLRVKMPDVRVGQTFYMLFPGRCNDYILHHLKENPYRNGNFKIRPTYYAKRGSSLFIMQHDTEVYVLPTPLEEQNEIRI